MIIILSIIPSDLLHDNSANKRYIMKKIRGADSDTLRNSHAVKKRNRNINQEEDTMTHAAYFNLNNQRSLSNVREFDHDEWYHYTGNSIVIKNDIDLDLKKFIKNRIYSKKTRFPRTQIKVQL